MRKRVPTKKKPLPDAKPGHIVDKHGRQIRLPGGPPYIVEHGVCARCEASPFVIVPNVDPATGMQRGVGLGAHVMLCSEMCMQRPWVCHKCDGAKVPMHTKWCEVAYPGYRAKWEADRASFGGQMLKLATMIAMREEMLPPFLMEMLFDPGRNAHMDLGMGSHF